MSSEIILDASSWKNKNDFYTAYCNITNAPNWFGRNLDAFLDSLRGGICKITPTKIIIRNVTSNIKNCIGATFFNDLQCMCQEEDVEFELYNN